MDNLGKLKKIWNWPKGEVSFFVIVNFIRLPFYSSIRINLECSPLVSKYYFRPYEMLHNVQILEELRKEHRDLKL